MLCKMKRGVDLYHLLLLGEGGGQKLLILHYVLVERSLGGWELVFLQRILYRYICPIACYVT